VIELNHCDAFRRADKVMQMNALFKTMLSRVNAKEIIFEFTDGDLEGDERTGRVVHQNHLIKKNLESYLASKRAQQLFNSPAAINCKFTPVLADGSLLPLVRKLDSAASLLTNKVDKWVATPTTPDEAEAIQEVVRLKREAGEDVDVVQVGSFMGELLKLVNG
jgi:hypothetical protein